MRTCLTGLFRVFAVVILTGTLAPIGLGQDCTVSTILRVRDKQEQLVTNLAAGQLKAEINGGAASISSFSPPAKPAIILMLDASGSMKGTWNQVIAAAREFVGKAGEDIAVLIFDEQIRGRAIGRTASEKLLDQWATETLDTDQRFTTR